MHCHHFYERQKPRRNNYYAPKSDQGDVAVSVLEPTRLLAVAPANAFDSKSAEQVKR
jgi:hypothetical protein